MSENLDFSTKKIIESILGFSTTSITVFIVSSPSISFKETIKRLFQDFFLFRFLISSTFLLSSPQISLINFCCSNPPQDVHLITPISNFKWTKFLCFSSEKKKKILYESDRQRDEIKNCLDSVNLPLMVLNELFKLRNRKSSWAFSARIASKQISQISHYETS